jgi:hypothetical protein
MWQKNIENGEFIKAERLQDGYVFATEEEIKAIEYQNIKNQYIEETFRRRENILANGKIEITTDAGELWLVKIDKNTVAELQGVELLFRLVDKKTQGQFYNWNTNNDIIITNNDLIKLANEINKYTNTVGGEKNIYAIQEEIIAEINKYTTYEQISSPEATQKLHNELDKFYTVEIELRIYEAVASDIVVPEQQDAGTGGRNLDVTS